MNYCTTCAYCQKTGHLTKPLLAKASDGWLCTENAVERDPVTGFATGPDMIGCVYARRVGGRCGPEGTLFKKAT